MPSIYGSDNAPGALPTFSADVQQATRVREFAGSGGQEMANVFGNLSRELGAWSDRAAADVGKQQGETAGLDPNYRPDQDESVMGIARRNAATQAYGNNLEASARNQLGDAWETFSNLPAAQRAPAALKATFAGIKDDFDQNHVFDAVKGPFDLAFGRMSDAYLRQAQTDADTRQQDAAKASFLVNQNSARTAALRTASLPSASDADITESVRQHNAAVDAAVAAGTYTATQAVALKDGFQQDVISQRVLAQFQATPDDKKPAFLANFRSTFLRGSASESEQQLADRIHSLSPTLTNEQCVELARKAGGISEGVTSWRKGASATQGQLPIGTPVATFLNRDGTPSNLYDGGAGVGAPGNNTTHAGVVAGYTPEGDLKLWEQYAGSGGPHIQVYKRGDERGGEKDANNYYSINGASGQPIGVNNPLVARGLPPARVNGLGFDTVTSLENTMTSALRGMNSQAEHVQKAALHDIDADVKQMEAGVPVREDEWSAKKTEYGASNDPVVAQAFAQGDAIRTMYQGFKGQTPQQVEAAVATMRGALTEGATPYQAKIVEAAEKYAAQLRKDFDRDPLARAAADGVIKGVTPLDFSSPASTSATLTARLAAADQTQQHYGLARAPLVTPDDRETVKAIAAAGGEPMVQAAGAIAATLGRRAGAFFSEIGGDAPSFAHLGVLAATGGDPGLMRDAAWAIAQDHGEGSKVQRPAPEELQRSIESVYGSAFRSIPPYAQGAKAVASSALAATIMREGLDPKALDAELVKQTLQKAAGATYVGGVQFGGVTQGPNSLTPGDYFRTTQKVLAPSNMRADQFVAAVRAITDADLAALPAPPRAADGSIMTAAALRDAHFNSLGPGVYQISLGDPLGEDPHWVNYRGGGRGASGRFTLDLSAMEPQLRARLPGAYR